ncbi:hypothetical protein, partial [Microbacterium azadirachtae]|uniref:hypothetical protein n=1 Tax=Microbacterium azadirachtae TaxID=582680 RepID=UPI0008812A1A
TVGACAGFGVAAAIAASGAAGGTTNVLAYLAGSGPKTAEEANSAFYTGMGFSMLGGAVGLIGKAPVSLLANSGKAALTGTKPAPATQSAESAAAESSKSIKSLLQPGGQKIGQAGSDDTIREISGGFPEAKAMFENLSQGGKIVEQTSKLTRVELPDGGYVQLRTVMSRSPDTAATIDVNVPGLDIRKLKFNP